MYAKSMIEYARTHWGTGGLLHCLSYLPVAMVLAIAILPFTLSADYHYQQQPVAQRDVTDSAEAPGTIEVTQSVTANADGNAKAKVPKRAALPKEQRYKVIAGYMARKYRVSQDVVFDLVKTAHVVGRKMGIDPLLIVAVIAVESSFNPIAESVAGAKGLMQIIPKYHPEKFVEFGGEQSAFEPHTNILVGSRIIREYLSASSGNMVVALQTYAGALADRDAVYTRRVLNEKDRLDELSGLPKTHRSIGVARLDGTNVRPESGRISVSLPAVAPVAPVPEIAPTPDPLATPEPSVLLEPENTVIEPPA
jgi:hypothetical protein